MILRQNFSRLLAVLACAFQDPIHVWSGCLDGKLKSYDINSNQETNVQGQHDNSIRCIEYSNDINAVSKKQKQLPKSLPITKLLT
jgi:cell cycle arrest protein BUB3